MKSSPVDFRLHTIAAHYWQYRIMHTSLLVANLYARDMTGAVPELAKACFELYSNKSFQTWHSDSISWTALDQNGFYDPSPFSRSQESRMKQKVVVFHF